MRKEFDVVNSEDASHLLSSPGRGFRANATRKGQAETVGAQGRIRANF